MSSTHDQGDKDDEMLSSQKEQCDEIGVSDKNLPIENKELQSKEHCSNIDEKIDNNVPRPSTKDLEIVTKSVFVQKDMEDITKKSPRSEDELSNSTLEEELKLRWDDDDDDLEEFSQDMTSGTDKSDLVEETSDVTINDPSNSYDNFSINRAQSSSGYTSVKVSPETSSINKEHSLRKPDAMLEIHTQELIDMEEFEDHEFDKYSDKESNGDTDNNLSDLLSKVHADIAESLNAMESTEVDDDIELTSDADEDLEVSLNKEKPTQDNVKVTEQHEDLESVSQKETLVEKEVAEIKQITVPEIINKPSLSGAITKEIKILAETMTSIDEVGNSPSSSNQQDLTSPPKSNEQRQEDIALKSLNTNMNDNLQMLDTFLEVDTTPSEKREKEINFKVSTLISNIEEEMQLLDSQEEQVLARAEQKQKEVVVKVSTIMSSLEKEIQLLDSDEKITEIPTIAVNNQKSKVKATKNAKKAKQGGISVEENLIEKSKNIDKLKNSNRDEVKDPKGLVTDKAVDAEKGDTNTECKETKPELKEEDEIALAIKAIEQSYDNYEPPMPTVVKVTDVLPEIATLDETDLPSTSIDDDVEMMDQDEPVLVGDECEVSVIPDSDDDDQPVLVGQNVIPENTAQPLTAAIGEQTKTDIESSQDKEIDKEIKVDSTIEKAEIANTDTEIKNVPDSTTSLNSNELNNDNLPETSASIAEVDSSTKSQDSKSTFDNETGESVHGDVEMDEKKVALENSEPKMSLEETGDILQNKVQPDASNTKDVEIDSDNLTNSKKDLPEKPIDNDNQRIDNIDPEPSTSADLDLNKDSSNDMPENSDSLGLLTESTRIMEDDEEQDEDDDSEDFSHDEESNLMTAENSDDSNPAPPEIDIQKQLEALTDVDDNNDNAQDATEIIENQARLMEPSKDRQEQDTEVDALEDRQEESQLAVSSEADGRTDEATERDINETMECDVDDTPECDVDEAPECEVDEAPECEIDEAPECDVDEAPECDVDAAPECDVDEAPECDVDEAPECDVDEAPECDIDETPESEIQLEAVSVKDGNKKSEDTDPTKSDDHVDMETVKLSDNSDNETDNVSGPTKPIEKPVEKEEQSPSKIKNLSICANVSNILNIVDLEESSEDEIQVVKPAEVEAAVHQKTDSEKPQQAQPESEPVAETQPPSDEPVPAVDTAHSEDMNIEVLDEEVLNGEETQLDTTDNSEVFNVDSDEDETNTTAAPESKPMDEQSETQDFKCVNSDCVYIPGARCYLADASTVAFYNGGKKGHAFVCEHCLRRVETRNAELIEGIRNCTSLLELEMGNFNLDLVEISDSDSDGEDDLDIQLNEKIGETGAKFVENELEELLNDTWKKMEMDTRIAETETVLQMEMKSIEKEANELRKFLNECQATTDQIRNDLYASFPQDIKQLPPLMIYDTPEHKYCYIQASQSEPPKIEASSPAKTRLSKRRLESAAAAEMPAKRPAIPLGYAPLDSDVSASKPTESSQPDNNEKSATINVDSDVVEKIDDDDNTDVSVVKVITTEAAPPGLPPPGELVKPPLKEGVPVYAMRNSFGSWVRAWVLDVLPKGTHSANFTSCKVRFQNRTGKTTILPARCLAYSVPATTRMTIGTRVIALFKDKDNSGNKESYYSGIVAEVPNPVNNYRYLIFFDDGYAQYAKHADTRLVCECSNLVWEEVHPFSREFVKEYLLAYPERPMVRLHPFQSLKTEWNGKWWSSRVVTVDASLAQVHFPVHNRYEWIYRGSTRLAPLYLELQAAERQRPRAMPRTQAHSRANMPVVEYTRFDEETNKVTEVDKPEPPHQQRADVEVNYRSVAKKSTSVVVTSPQAAPPPPRAHTGPNLDNVTSRVVYYTPKNAVKPHKLVPHVCGPKCKRTDVLGLKELRTYNPLAKPLLSGWERQIVRYKGQKAVAYRAPCGRRIRDVKELHRYLRAVKCELPVDLFDFAPHTHCLAEFVLNKCLIMKKDLSQGKENVPVPCVNYYDQSLPEFCTYNTERTPTAGVPLNLDPEFLCGCDCEDDCEDKTKCACWKLTLEGARTIGFEGDNIGYVYKRLPEPLPSGIYECNSRCKCKHTCLNRVAQHPLQLKLQVFKTLNRGWGIRALNDVPKGSFLCVYAGNLLTDATANLDGLNEGDEYLAELDYIEVVEQMKEGYEEDIPEALKKLDLKQKNKGNDNDEEEEEEQESSEDDSKSTSKNEMKDDDFRPGYIGLGVAEFSKRLRKRNRNKEGNKEKKENEKEKDKEKKGDNEKKEDKGSNDDDCITISDDDEVREPSRFSAAAGMGANEFVSKYRSVRTLFGEDEACYIMDAKVQGNIGRYLNHSCSPNVFVQNVFVDTHDPRFPWVAFFALSHVRAGTELTWNYNYDVGSVPGKALYCYCGAHNCRGRLL